MTSCWISPESAAVSPAQKAQQPSSRGPYPQGTGTRRAQVPAGHRYPQGTGTRRAQVRRSGIPAAPITRDCRSAKTQWLRSAPLQASDWTKRGSSPKGAGAFSAHFWAAKSGPAGGKPTESQKTGLWEKNFHSSKKGEPICRLSFQSVEKAQLRLGFYV